MMRSIVFLISVFCVATVLTELLGLAYLWFNGQLTPTAMQDIRVALGAEEAPAIDDAAEKKAIAKSNDDIVRMRIERGFDLQRRLQEVRIFNSMTAEKAAQVKADRLALEKLQQEFQQQLATIAKDLNGESTEQARSILLKMKPADAVNNLMSLTIEQNVLLLKGMPEKSIASILQEFMRGNDPKRIERERMIFERISAGEPSRSAIDNVANRTGAVAAPKAPPKKAPAN